MGPKFFSCCAIGPMSILEYFFLAHPWKFYTLRNEINIYGSKVPKKVPKNKIQNQNGSKNVI